MAYSDFTTLRKALDKLNLLLNEQTFFLDEFQPVEPGEALKQYLELTIPSASVGSEKARSEGIVYPLLVELRRIQNNQISIFSGEEFTVDLESGLNGVCDFLICKSPLISVVDVPVVAVVEAKKSDISLGLGQCAAEMVAALRFNQANDVPINRVSGIVTTGTLWRYLHLCDRTIQMDVTDYPLLPLSNTLGRLSSLINLP